MKSLITKLKCCLLGHKWTANVEKKIPPTDKQLRSGIEGFWDYARMYCDRCGKQSRLNKIK